MLSLSSTTIKKNPLEMPHPLFTCVLVGSKEVFEQKLGIIEIIFKKRYCYNII
jgi:hypothetical protein